MRFYFRFSPVEGCMSVNMFTFEADDEIHQCRRWCVTRAISAGSWPGSRNIAVYLHVATKRKLQDGRDSVSLRARPWAIKIAPPL